MILRTQLLITEKTQKWTQQSRKDLFYSHSMISISTKNFKLMMIRKSVSQLRTIKISIKVKNNTSRVPLYRITATKEANEIGVSGMYVIQFRALITE